MKQLEIEAILKRNFISCDPEECWNGCSINDKYGYIDVSVVFKRTPEIITLFGDLINDEAGDVCWIWACSTSKGGRGTKYFLAGMESDPRINGRTNLAKAINHLYKSDINQEKKDFYKELKKEEEY